jgi:hypothetical protein
VIDEWFKTYLPVMDAFWKRVLYFREHLDEVPMPKEKVKRPRKTKELPPPVCEVQALSMRICMLKIEFSLS